MTIDLDERLADLRATAHLSADQRSAVLTQVLAADASPHRQDHRFVAGRRSRHRRTIAFAAAAGLAAAACIAIPAVLPSGTPGAANQAAAVQALHHLAHVAAITAVSPSDHIGPNQYLHYVEVDHQAATPGQLAEDHRYEYWVRSDGLTYQRRIERNGNGQLQEEVWLTPPGPQVIDGMRSPQFLDRLPTDPAALESYVLAHSVGSTSPDERVFVAVADIVRRGLAESKLRSAAIEVLARLGHVKLGDTTRDSLGNPVQEFEFVDPNGRPDEITALMFDTRTAQITEEHDYLHGEAFAARTVPVFDIVDTVPASIREHAVVQK